jgi:hypothetical protein
MRMLAVAEDAAAFGSIVVGSQVGLRRNALSPAEVIHIQMLLLSAQRREPVRRRRT